MYTDTPVNVIIITLFFILQKQCNHKEKVNTEVGTFNRITVWVNVMDTKAGLCYAPFTEN